MPRGSSPAWQPRREDGLLDVQYLRADLRFGRTRAVLATLRVRVLSGPQQVAYDGETGETTTEFVFGKREQLTVHARR